MNLSDQCETGTPYQGRIAPSPTGYLHLGHARTFYTAYSRALKHNGWLIYRDEDLDFQRCKPEFSQAAVEDLLWLGIRWKGDVIRQSQRLPLYREAFERLKKDGFIYPCICSRKDVAQAASAPHPSPDGEPIYPGTCRERSIRDIPRGTQIVWRFRVPDGETIRFHDGHFGEQSFIAGKSENADFGDFIVWRHDDLPSYQLAVTVDDAQMGITEVVRGADLLLSTARQLLLYRALGLKSPCFYHCPLVTDENGNRLAKRCDSLSLRALRNSGITPQEIISKWCDDV